MMLFFLPIVLLAGYFTGPGTPAVIKYSPELCGILASAYLVIYSVRHGFQRIRLVYWFLILFIGLHLLFGVIANEVKPGTLIIGGRLYLRTLPFFLLAIAVTPNERALKKQFLILLAVSLLQLPVAIYQRLTRVQEAAYAGKVSYTGDYVMGTIGGSGQLSLFLLGVATIVVALYARKHLSARLATALLLLVLAPTTINETKATFLLAPLAIAIPMLAMAQGNRIKYTIKSLILIAGFTAVFIPIYDYLVTPRWGYGLLDFFTMEGRVEGYLTRDVEVGTTTVEPGRLDSVTVALGVITEDPTTAMFGLGMGNVTESVLGSDFQGHYFDRYGIFVKTTYGRLLFEIGILGTALVLFVIWQIFIDARRLYSRPDAFGVLAQAQLAIIPIMVIGMLYKDLIVSPALSVCFWYYCGVVVAASQFQTDSAPTVAPAERLNMKSRLLPRQTGDGSVSRQRNQGLTSSSLSPKVRKS
jgi:hypothetical protein